MCLCGLCVYVYGHVWSYVEWVVCSVYSVVWVRIVYVEYKGSVLNRSLSLILSFPRFSTNSNLPKLLTVSHIFIFLYSTSLSSSPLFLPSPPGVLHSITQPVTTKWLLEVIENHRWRPTPSLAGVKRKERPTSEGDEDATHMPPQKIISQRD